MRFFYFHNLVTVGQTYESQFILKKNIHQEIFFSSRFIFTKSRFFICFHLYLKSVRSYSTQEIFPRNSRNMVYISRITYLYFRHRNYGSEFNTAVGCALQPPLQTKWLLGLQSAPSNACGGTDPHSLRVKKELKNKN